MKNILCSTVATLALTTAAYADTPSSVFSSAPFNPEINLHASEMIGKRVYASEAAIDETMQVPSIGDTDWEDIGEINEILLTRDGDVQSVIVGVGGFLGLGEKDVSVNMSELKFVEENGDAGDMFLVINANTVGLQDAPGYERPGISTLMEGRDDSAGLSAPNDYGEGMVKPAEDTAARSGEMESPMETGIAALVPPAGFDRVASDDLTAEDLAGAPVLGTDNEEVGEVAELLITEEGDIDRAVIDVAGFLGFGEYPVTIPMEQLAIVQAADSGDLRVYIDASEEALKQRPEYNG